MFSFFLSTILRTLENVKKCNNFILIFQIGQDISIKIEQFPVIVLIPGYVTGLIRLVVS